MKTSKIEVIMADGSQTPNAVIRAVESRIADMTSCDDLLAENERLREALRDILQCRDGTWATSDKHWAEAEVKARAALAR